MCARARERKNGSAQTLRPGRDAGRRARGAEKGARRARRGAERSAPGAVYAQAGACTAGRGAQLPRSLRPGPSQVRVRGWRGSAGCGSGRRARGTRAAAAATGGGGASGRAAHSGVVRLGLSRGRLPSGSGGGGGRWTPGERLAALDLSPSPGKRLARIPAPVRPVVFIRWIGHLDFLFSCPEAGCRVRDGGAERCALGSDLPVGGEVRSQGELADAGAHQLCCFSG